jgi:hypothetical protein
MNAFHAGIHTFYHETCEKHEDSIYESKVKPVNLNATPTLSGTRVSTMSEISPCPPSLAAVRTCQPRSDPSKKKKSRSSVTFLTFSTDWRADFQN